MEPLSPLPPLPLVVWQRMYHVFNNHVFFGVFSSGARQTPRPTLSPDNYDEYFAVALKTIQKLFNLVSVIPKSIRSPFVSPFHSFSQFNS